MSNLLQLPPNPAEVLGLSDITIIKMELTKQNEFIITVESTQQDTYGGRFRHIAI